MSGLFRNSVLAGLFAAVAIALAGAPAQADGSAAFAPANYWDNAVLAEFKPANYWDNAAPVELEPANYWE